MHFSCIIVDEVYYLLTAEIFTIVSYRGEGFQNFNNKLLTSYEYYITGTFLIITTLATSGPQKPLEA